MSCKKESDAEFQLVSGKAERFYMYANALDQCKKLPLDSLLKCTAEIVDIDTLSGINTVIWHMYGRAKGLVHNRKEMEAIEVINQALIETEKNDLLFEKAEFLQLRSFIYSNSFKNAEAAEDLFKAADLYMKLGLRKEAAASYLGMENLQFSSGNYQLAIENGLFAIQLINDNLVLDREDSVRIKNAYNTMGLAYYRLNDYDNALKYYDSSLYYAVLLKDEFWQGLVTGNLAVILFRQGKTEEALDKFETDIRTSLKYKDLSSASNAYLSVGEVFIETGKYRLAKNYLDSAYRLLNQVDFPTIRERYYKNMSEWHQLIDDHSKALSYYKKHITLRDSIQEILTKSQLEKIQNERTFEEQLADINLLKAENDLRAKELRFSRASIIALILIFLLLSGLLYTIKKNNNALNELNLKLEDKVRARTAKLKKINSELDTYLYRASHDVRRPILTIIGLSQVADLTPYNQERFAIHQTIKKTAYEMDNMLKKLQMAYQLEKEEEQFTLNLKLHLEDLILDFTKLYPSAKFSVVEDKETIIKTKRRFLDIALTNVLENACIFSSEENPAVSVEIGRTESFITISIRDNGIGVEPYFIDSIFDAYTRYSNKSQGSGIGLYLARKAMKKIGGKISVTSKKKSGSDFVIKVPLNRFYLS